MTNYKNLLFFCCSSESTLCFCLWWHIQIQEVPCGCCLMHSWPFFTMVRHGTIPLRSCTKNIHLCVQSLWKRFTLLLTYQHQKAMMVDYGIAPMSQVCTFCIWNHDKKSVSDEVSIRTGGYDILK